MKKHVSDRQRCTVKDRVAAYEYDGQNRRVVKEVYSGGSLDHTLDMYYNESWQILEVRKDGDADPLKQYVWHTFYIDAPAIRYYDADTDGAGVETQYFTHDANMNVTALIDDEGDVIERYDYTPYGQVTILNPNFSDDADGVSDYEQDVLFAGYQYDAESGMYHVRHRNYDPMLGRWVQRDPNEYVDGMSMCQYVQNDPVAWLDPTGSFRINPGVSGILPGPARPVSGILPGPARPVSGILPGPARPVSGILPGSARPVSGVFPSASQGIYSWHSAQQCPPPQNSLIDLIGKIWNAPNTVIGLGWGGVGVLFGGAPVTFGNNAIQFENHPFMFGAITLGNTISYAPGFGPGIVGDHELQHTYQGQVLGPFYLPANLIGGTAGVLGSGYWHGPENFMEVGPQMNPPRPFR